MLIYVAPALMALSLEARRRAARGPGAAYGLIARARTAALGGLLPLGLTLGAIGTVCALQPRPADENPPVDYALDASGADTAAGERGAARAPQPLLVCRSVLRSQERLLGSGLGLGLVANPSTSPKKP